MNTNLCLKEIYHNWYLISKENLLKEHPLLRYDQGIDQRGVRLFYLNNVSGDLDMDEMIAPRTEINLYIKNVNNQDNKNYFLERERDFQKYFLKKETLWNMKIKKILSLTSRKFIILI